MSYGTEACGGAISEEVVCGVCVGEVLQTISPRFGNGRFNFSIEERVNKDRREEARVGDVDCRSCCG